MSNIGTSATITRAIYNTRWNYFVYNFTDIGHACDCHLLCPVGRESGTAYVSYETDRGWVGEVLFISVTIPRGRGWGTVYVSYDT